MSLLFFTIGALVRLMGSPVLAEKILSNGGVSALVGVLGMTPLPAATTKSTATGVAPASVIQVGAGSDAGGAAALQTSVGGFYLGVGYVGIHPWLGAL